MPGKSDALCGATATLATIGGVTVSVVELVNPPKLAVMVGQVSMAPCPLQIPTVCANPLLGSIVAMFGFEDVQVAKVVTLKLPLAP